MFTFKLFNYNIADIVVAHDRLIVVTVDGDIVDI